MKLLLVTQDFPPKTGGIETYCFELSKRFYKAYDYFAVLAPSHPSSDAVDNELPYDVFRVPVKDSLLPLAVPFSLLRLIPKYKFDYVFHAQWQTAMGSVLARMVTGYPRKIYAAAHARELLIQPFAGNGGSVSRLLNAGRKKLFKQLDNFFPVSNYTGALLNKEGVPDNKIHVVGNGTDPEFFTPKNTTGLRQKIGAEERTILFSVCRLVPRKGMDLVLYALRELLKERDDFLYLIGGSGEDEDRLKSLCSDLDLDHYVQFLGRIPDCELPTYYSLADIFVMPARNNPPDVEGFGIVFLEANACETPVVGSNTGGIPDAIIDGETGLLVDEENVTELVKALKKIMNDKTLAANMGKRGRERVVKQMNWDTASEKLLELF